jgi:hypothetical protein
MSQGRWVRRSIRRAAGSVDALAGVAGPLLAISIFERTADVSTVGVEVDTLYSPIRVHLLHRNTNVEWQLLTKGQQAALQQCVKAVG